MIRECFKSLRIQKSQKIIKIVSFEELNIGHTSSRMSTNSGWMVVEWMPMSWKNDLICSAICM